LSGEPGRRYTVARTKNTPNDPERRARILEATVGLLQDDGVSAISARAVATRAGVPVGSVSYHFDSVRALLLEAARSIIKLREASLTSWGRTVTAPTIHEQLAALVHTQITTGRAITVVASALSLRGLRARHVPEADARHLATLADGLQLHSLFRRPAPGPDELAAALRPPAWPG